MKCVTCKNGETLNSKTTVTFEKNGSTFIFKDVPCSKCEQCGEVYLDDNVSSKLIDQIELLSRSGGEVSIQRYTAA